jgi:hypothetical protein
MVEVCLYSNRNFMAEENKKEKIEELNKENNQKNDNIENTESIELQNESVEETAEVEIEKDVNNNESDKKTDAEEGVVTKAPIMWKPYAIAGALILVIGVVLLYGLEKQGRVDSNIFGSISEIFAGPVAVVNGEPISRKDFNRSYNQVIRELQMQGFDPSADSDMIANLQDQTMQSLISSTLLVQAASRAEISISNEQVDERFSEIEEGNGGPEELARRIAEFGLSKKDLRRDIRKELAIQAHLNDIFDMDVIDISDEEVQLVYDEIVASNPGLEVPPLDDEVKSILAQQLRNDRRQTLIGDYIETMRVEAVIEIRL